MVQLRKKQRNEPEEKEQRDGGRKKRKKGEGRREGTKRWKVRAVTTNQARRGHGFDFLGHEKVSLV